MCLTVRADQVKNKYRGKMNFGEGKVCVTSTGIKEIGEPMCCLINICWKENEETNCASIFRQFLFLIIVIFCITSKGKVTLNLTHCYFCNIWFFLLFREIGL